MQGSFVQIWPFDTPGTFQYTLQCPASLLANNTTTSLLLSSYDNQHDPHKASDEIHP